MDVEDAYELERQRIIRENQALLESLGLGVKHLAPKKTATPVKRPPVVKGEPSRSSSRIKASSSSSVPTRRSSRNTEDPLNIRPSRRNERSLSDFIVRDEDHSDDDGHPKQRHGEGLGKGVALARKHDPKRFGSIPDVPVGKTWPLRVGASMDAIHAPLVACISGNPSVGAWSICFSGGYEDNVDRGTSFVLTGAGGRDLKGNGKNLRTANQSFDQSFEHAMNGALRRSAKTGKPVRVVRGYKTDSEWAPLAGYRYDGLYTVTSAKLVHSSATGFKVCTFEFKRLSGQPRIPRRSETVIVDPSTGSPSPDRVDRGVVVDDDDDDDDDDEAGQADFDMNDDSADDKADENEVDELALGFSPAPTQNARSSTRSTGSTTIVVAPVRPPGVVKQETRRSTRSSGRPIGVKSTRASKVEVALTKSKRVTKVKAAMAKMNKRATTSDTIVLSRTPSTRTRSGRVVIVPDRAEKASTRMTRSRA